MSVVYNTSILNSRLTVVRDAIDAGSSNGVLRIYSAGYGSLMSSIMLDKPCGTVGGGLLTFSVPRADPLIAASGEPSVARMYDSDGTLVAYGLTVGASTDKDIVLGTTPISSGDSLSLIYGVIQGN